MRRLIALLAAFPLVAANPGADGLNRFAADLYRQLGGRGGNIVFSPVSISTALAMTLAGARGQTAQEMQSVLRTPPDAAFLDQISRAAKGGDELLLAQSLWVDRGFPLQPAFVEASKEQFHAEPAPADFSNRPEEARGAINRWVSEQTRNKIMDLFAPGTLDRSTRLVLASAIYFNGKWERPFEAKETRPSEFHTGKGTVQTPFMNQSARFPYAETATAQILELPYHSGSLVFDVVLPKSGSPLSTLEQAFGQGGLSAWVGQLQRKQVVVSLPRFRAEASYSLQPALSAMGMASAFARSADFSGIDGRRDLAISQVVHKAYIDVSEEGTEAAAATGVAVALTAFAQPVVFRADHPFLFFIRETGTGAILFAGRMESPQVK